MRCAALVPDHGSYFFGDDDPPDDGTAVPVEAYRVVHQRALRAALDRRHSWPTDARTWSARSRGSPQRRPDRRAGRWKPGHALGRAVPCQRRDRTTIAQVVELVYSVEHALGDRGGLPPGIGLAPRCRGEPFERARRAGNGGREVPRGILFHSTSSTADGPGGGGRRHHADGAELRPRRGAVPRRGQPARRRADEELRRASRDRRPGL
jgi:hypothetical protein